MPTFATPEPITLTIEVIGDVRIMANDRTDTVVVVRAGDPSKADDVKAAEQTTVDFRNDRLDIKAAKTWRRYTPFGGNEKVDVTVEVPTGSSVIADLALGHLSLEGELGECRLKTAMGNIRVDQTGPLHATTGYGNIAVDRVVGDAELKTGSGEVRVDVVEGAALVRNSNGHSTIGEVIGDLQVKAANGDVAVGRAHASATVKTANGRLRVGEVGHGTIVLETHAGDVEVGVSEDTAVWLDVVTKFGSVRNTLDTGGAPLPSQPTVEVRARTTIGDIRIGPAPSLHGSGRSERSDAP